MPGPSCDKEMVRQLSPLKFIVAVFLIASAVAFRWLTFTQGVAVNVEIVTLVSLLAGVYLGGKWGLLVPLLSMSISDRLIGNTSIYYFTWSGYLVIGLIGLAVRRGVLERQPALRKGFFLASFCSVFFYLWTNFGVWFQGWYEPTWEGLWRCYLMGLPFLKYNLISNLLFVPLTFGLIESAQNHSASIMARGQLLLRGIVGEGKDGV